MYKLIAEKRTLLNNAYKWRELKSQIIYPEKVLRHYSFMRSKIAGLVKMRMIRVMYLVCLKVEKVRP